MRNLSNRLQASRDPLPADEVASIWETTKDLGVLIGKGGLYGTVSALCNVHIIIQVCSGQVAAGAMPQFSR